MHQFSAIKVYYFEFIILLYIVVEWLKKTSYNRILYSGQILLFKTKIHWKLVVIVLKCIQKEIVIAESQGWYYWWRQRIFSVNRIPLKNQHQFSIPWFFTLSFSFFWILQVKWLPKKKTKVPEFHSLIKHYNFKNNSNKN